jgi:hypothetical protein
LRKEVITNHLKSMKRLQKNMPQPLVTGAYFLDDLIYLVNIIFLTLS